MVRPSVRTKVTTVAFPETTIKKKTVMLMARTAKKGFPWPLPNTEMTEAAKRWEMAMATNRLMTGQLSVATDSCPAMNPWWNPPHTPAMPIHKKNYRQWESAAALGISLAAPMKATIPSVKSVRELAGSTRVNS